MISFNFKETLELVKRRKPESDHVIEQIMFIKDENMYTYRGVLREDSTVKAENYEKTGEKVYENERQIDENMIVILL